MGWYVVLRRQTLVSHTLSVMAVPGATGAALAGLTVSLGYYLAYGIAALAIGRGGDRSRRGYGGETATIGTGRHRLPAILALAVAATSQITGALLVFALLVAPAACAQQVTLRPLAGLALSIGFALLISWLALGIAYFTIYPVGFPVTSIAFALYVVLRADRWRRERRR